MWCSDNNLVLNTTITKEMTVDFRRTRKTTHTPLHLNGKEVQYVENIAFPGIHITKDLTWSLSTTHLVTKAQQRFFFLRKLKAKCTSHLNFYRSTIERIL